MIVNEIIIESARQAGRNDIDWLTWTASDEVQAAVNAWPTDRIPTDEWEAAYVAGRIEGRIERGHPIRWTTAPADYDFTGFGTVELAANVGELGGKVVRRVLCDPHHANYQEGRYGSGCHGVWKIDPVEDEHRAQERLAAERAAQQVRDETRTLGLAWLKDLSDADLETAREADEPLCVRYLTQRDARDEQAARQRLAEGLARAAEWARCRALVPDGCVLVDDGDEGGYDKVGEYTYRRPHRDSRVYYDVRAEAWTEDVAKARVNAQTERRGDSLGTLDVVVEQIEAKRLRVATAADVPPKPVLDRVGHSQLAEVRRVEVAGRVVWVGRERFGHEPLVLDERGRLVRARAVLAAVNNLLAGTV